MILVILGFVVYAVSMVYGVLTYSTSIIWPIAAILGITVCLVSVGMLGLTCL
jgi:hypothetical protein